MPTVTRKPGPDADRLRVFVAGLDGLRGKVGWFESSHYPNGVPVAYVAAIQEFGYPAGGIPPRLGMRATAKEKTGEWREVARRGAKAALKGGTSAYAAMELLGLKAAGDVRKHISQVTSPPLKAATIQARLRKRSNKSKVGNLTKPLVDSGELIDSLTNRTERGKG
jgi:hypothetical protein